MTLRISSFLLHANNITEFPLRTSFSASRFHVLYFHYWLVKGSFILYRGFPDSSVGKETVCNAGDPGLIPGLGRSAGEGKGYPFQYSGLVNSIDCIVHGVTKSWI